MTLRHTDELLDIVERNVDEDDMTRMLKHDYRLTPEEEQPDYVVKGNRVFEALMDFIKLLKHTVYIFHVNDEKKTGRASVLLHHILGYEETSTEEGRYWVISQVKDYGDV